MQHVTITLDGEVYGLAELQPPACVARYLVWASRLCVLMHARNESSAEHIARMANDPLSQAIFDRLTSIWAIFLAGTHESVLMHRLNCPGLSLHEQALVMAVRCLQGPDDAGYVAAMSSILPPTCIRAVRRDIEGLARLTTEFERERRRAFPAAQPGLALASSGGESRRLH